MGGLAALLIPRPFPVGILVKTPAQIERAIAQGDFFIGEVLTRGRVLEERGD